MMVVGGVQLGTITQQRLLPPLVVTSPYMDNSVDLLW